MRQAIITFIVFTSCCCSFASAQVKKPLIDLDSLKVKAKKSLTVDTSKLKKITELDKKLYQSVNDKLKQSPISKVFKKDSLPKRQKIKLTDFELGHTIQYVNASTTSPVPNYLNRTEVAGQLEIYKFPINLELVNNYNPMNNFNLGDNSLFKFDLDKQQFTQFYQGDIDKYKKLKNTKFSGQNVRQFVQNKIKEKIQSRLSHQITNHPKLMAYLNNPDAINSLIKMDEAQMKAKLNSVLTDLERDVKAKGESFYQEKKDSLTTTINNQVNEITSYVQSVKQDLADGGLDQEKIELIEKFLNKKMSENDLENLLVSQLTSQPKLKGVQKVYSKINEFKAGNFGDALPGSFLNRDLFLNGLSMAIKTAKGPVSLGIAVQKDIGLPKDMEFNRSLFSAPKLLTHVSIPTTNFSFGRGKLSWVGQYDRQFGKTLQQQSTAVPKTNMVFTASQNIDFHRLGKIIVEISKSTTQYNNLVNGPDQLIIGQTTAGNYFKDDFLQTMSLGFNHAFESTKMGMNSNVYFSYGGSGFQNPGQQNIANMNLRFGGHLRKNFFGNKVSFNLRSDLKNTPMSAEGNAHWQNYNVQLDSRVRLSKAHSLSFKYIENGVNKINSTHTPVYAGRKLQADYTANYKIGNRYGFSHLSVGRQDMDNLTLATTLPLADAQNMSQTNFLTANFAQTVMFTTFSLNGNVFYNKQLTANGILGDMLNSDVACQYTLFKGVSLSSGFTYLDNQNIARQVGLKQNIQFLFKKHFDVSGFVDFRKNLITPLYPDLFSKARAEVSIRYFLDKQ